MFKTVTFRHIKFEGDQLSVFLVLVMDQEKFVTDTVY